MSNPGLAKTFNAGAAVPQARIVKFGADERTVVVGAAVGDAIFGVSAFVGTGASDYASGKPVDVYTAGIVDVTYGGSVTVGDWLTTNGTGQAVASAPAAGANNNVIGRAMVGGASGDLGKVLISIGRIQG